MFVEVISSSSHIDFLFFTIASTILLQMTMAFRLEFYGSIGLFLYLIWPLGHFHMAPELLF